MARYEIKLARGNEWYEDGTPVFDIIGEFDDLKAAIEFNDLKGGCLYRPDGKALAPDGTWV